jgi:NADH dehydrogenase FAD-containing subunit
VYERGRAVLPAYLILAVAVGCTGALGDTITAAAQSTDHPAIELAQAANQPALELGMQVRDERLTLDVSPHGYRPLVAIATSRGETTTARLYLASMTKRLAATFKHILKRNGLAPPYYHV